VLAELTQLLELQAIDVQLHEASLQIERLLSQRKQTEERIAEAKLSIQQLRDQLAQLQHDSRMKNLAVDELDANIRQYRTRLDTGIISFKEMEDLRTKIDLERARMSKMEDEALELMETIETARDSVQQAAIDGEAQAAKLEERLREFSDQVAQTEKQADRLREIRSTALAGIPSYLTKQYAILSARAAEPVARLKNGTCSGCKLKLSGSTVERVRSSIEIVTCEHCSRILYVDDPSPGS